ncbi:pseudaminic acid cytidylyltransferase [Thiothrix subterranea]|uniref:pseudaminic acid cytidylyltransferase n=1 Tax=Thiothrix subterranea TaxID=2735563 RepID=UPI00192AAA6B|nr:pseudaminic acid cytidylyltransferase [Thiothrix subterranea]QQZ29930.1 pseudaminic acid cytidylyltransferase [Thiothrix subterranea]
MNIAIIPARGGSKRIPRKNIKDFCGKPMIAWSIEAALQSGCFERIIVSTDDEEIAEVALRLGAEVPFMRPEGLSGDFVATIPVIKHAIQWLEANQVIPEWICCIYATAPFISANALRSGLTLIQQQDADYAFSVTSYAFPIQRAIKFQQNSMVQMFSPKHFNTRSQDLEEAYHDAGQFYWGARTAWLEEKPIFSSESYPIILPRHLVQDIDTQEDWIRAELMFKAIEKNS